MTDTTNIRNAIKGPVRYDDGSDMMGNPCIRDAEGRHVCEITAWQYNWPAQGGKNTDKITPAYGHAVGNQIADALNRTADLEAKLATADARVQILGDCLSGYTSMCVNCLEPDEMHDENGFVDMLDEIGKMICGDPKYPAKEVLAKSRELANEALTTISGDAKGDSDGK